MHFWFIRMKQGTNGPDFAQEVWAKNRIGIMYGTWRLKHISGADGRIDPMKLSAAHINEVCPQRVHGFSEKWMKPIKKFFLEVQPDDRVVTVFGGSIHLGTVGPYLIDDETERLNGEFFKCRNVHDIKRFQLTDLPSVYRLIGNMQGTLAKIRAYLPHVELLERCADAQSVCAALQSMSVDDFLGMLGPEQWEVLCAEYLRDRIGFRFLLLQAGKTLKDVDLVGVDRTYRKVIAQCKNQSTPWAATDVKRWLASASIGANDIAVFCSRGGVSGDLARLPCAIVDGREIASWLMGSDQYFRSIKQM
jgi:hypothetical protein